MTRFSGLERCTRILIYLFFEKVIDYPQRGLQSHVAFIAIMIRQIWDHTQIRGCD